MAMKLCIFHCQLPFQVHKLELLYHINKYFLRLPGEGLYIDFNKGATPSPPPFVLLSPFAMPCDRNSISPAPDAVGHAWTRTSYRQVLMQWATPARENAEQNANHNVK